MIALGGCWQPSSPRGSDWPRRQGAGDSRGLNLIVPRLTIGLPSRPFAVAAALLFGLLAPAAVAETGTPCRVPFDVVRLAYPLSQVHQKLDAKQTVIVVAIGSSSTAGAGASSPDATYPSRLCRALAPLPGATSVMPRRQRRRNQGHARASIATCRGEAGPRIAARH